jgi:Cu(I)/Ag(I) efflux system periplasmic protein CusF
MRAGIAATLLAVALAACGEAVPEAQPSETMAMEAKATSAKGTGTVTAVDAAAGTVTIDPAPIPEIGWPAMTMAFRADPALLAGVAVGNMVAFDLTLEDNAGTITALTAK